MPIASPSQYLDMLDAAREGGYAFPAINVTSSDTLNAALAGFASADSDGIVQVSTGGGQFLSGNAVADMALGGTGFGRVCSCCGGSLSYVGGSPHRSLPTRSGG